MAFSATDCFLPVLWLASYACHSHDGDDDDDHDQDDDENGCYCEYCYVAIQRRSSFNLQNFDEVVRSTVAIQNDLISASY